MTHITVRPPLQAEACIFFYPMFHCSFYCRAVYNAERLLFRDSFFIQFASSDERKQKTNQRPI